MPGVADKRPLELRLEISGEKPGFTNANRAEPVLEEAARRRTAFCARGQGRGPRSRAQRGRMTRLDIGTRAAVAQEGIQRRAVVVGIPAGQIGKGGLSDTHGSRRGGR